MATRLGLAALRRCALHALRIAPDAVASQYVPACERP